MLILIWLFCVAVWFFTICCMVFLFTDEPLPSGSYVGIIGLAFALGTVVFGLTYLATAL